MADSFPAPLAIFPMYSPIFSLALPVPFAIQTKKKSPWQEALIHSQHCILLAPIKLTNLTQEPEFSSVICCSHIAEASRFSPGESPFWL